MKFQPRAKHIQYDAIKPSEFGDISGVVCREKMDIWSKLKSDSSLEGLVDLIVSWGAQRYQETEFVRAKEEFDGLMGKSFYDEASYHARMAYFLDYCSFARPVADEYTAQGRTPLEDVLENAPIREHISDENIKKLKILREYRHSLFGVEKVQKEGIIVRDLLEDQEKLFLRKNWAGNIGGYSKGCVLQGFIFPIEGVWQMSNGVLEHPKVAHNWIVKKIKESKKLKDYRQMRILSEFARKHLNSGRWRHENVLELYKRDHS
ncbi:MAG: hypothetical protein AB8C84_08540 [Oligoflexales bacterium]